MLKKYAVSYFNEGFSNAGFSNVCKILEDAHYHYFHMRDVRPRDRLVWVRDASYRSVES